MAKNWILEDEAAARFNVKPRTFRELVKAGKYQIEYRALNGRNFMYNEAHIDRLLENPERYINPAVQLRKPRTKPNTKQLCVT